MAIVNVLGEGEEAKDNISLTKEAPSSTIQSRSTTWAESGFAEIEIHKKSVHSGLARTNR